jgi:hypothetical protein
MDPHVLCHASIRTFHEEYAFISSVSDFLFQAAKTKQKTALKIVVFHYGLQHCLV